MTENLGEPAFFLLLGLEVVESESKNVPFSHLSFWPRVATEETWILVGK